MYEKNGIYGIAFGCPHIDRKQNCPLYNMDQMLIHERADWVDSLPVNEVSRLWGHHMACSGNRQVNAVRIFGRINKVIE